MPDSRNASALWNTVMVRHQERTRFFRSVGPEYDSIGNYLSDFRLEVLTGEEYVKISV
jgi:hypothetical protein